MKLKKKQEDWSLWFQLAEWVICFVKLDISLHIALSVGSHRPRPLPHEKFWEHNLTQYMLLKHTVLNSPFSTTVSLHMPKYLQNWCPPFLWFLKPISIKSHTKYSLWKAYLFHCSCKVCSTCPLVDSSSPDSAHSSVHLCFLYSPNSAHHVQSFHITPCQRSTGSKSCYSYRLKTKKHTHTRLTYTVLINA